MNKQGWTTKKAKRVIIVMSTFWYSTLGFYWVGRLLPFAGIEKDVLTNWLVGFIASLIAAIVILLVTATVVASLEWINEKE